MYQDSASLVGQYKKNANAVLDSLVRYEYLKARTSILKTQIDELRNSQKAGVVEMWRKNQSIVKCNEALDAQKLLNVRLQRSYKAANKERWIWRGLAAVGAYFLVR